MADEPELTENTESEEDTPQVETPPEKILGKFDNQEALKQGYVELERELGRLRQQQGEQQAEPAQSPVQPQPQDTEAYMSEMDSKFFDQPTATAAQIAQTIAQNLFQQDATATANIKREISKRKKDPMFADIGDDFEAALIQMKPQMLDPNVASATAENVYNWVIGQNVRKKASEAKADPKARNQILQSLGVEGVAPVERVSTGDLVGPKERAALEEIGINDKKTIDDIVAKMVNGEE